MSLLGIIAGGAVQAGIGAFNNFWGQQQQEEARRQNYMLGEMAAQNADARTRALYNDIYSPAALLKQYKEAGLSPSLMFGGTPGQGGQAGAQGTGANGPGAIYTPISMLEGAQIEAIKAQTDKTKAETENIEKDTTSKVLANKWQNMLNKEKSIEIELTTSYIINEDGSTTSLFELAQNCYDYEQFMKKTREIAERTGDNHIKLTIGTEAGQKTMRQIYMNANRFERDIKVLSQEGVNAEFQEKVLKLMSEKGFAEQNAKTTIEQLKALEETSKLTVEQKQSWNDILDRLRKTNSTMADIVIVLGMIFNNAATNWKFMDK